MSNTRIRDVLFLIDFLRSSVSTVSVYIRDGEKLRADSPALPPPSGAVSWGLAGQYRPQSGDQARRWPDPGAGAGLTPQPGHRRERDSATGDRHAERARPLGTWTRPRPTL